MAFHLEKRIISGRKHPRPLFAIGHFGVISRLLPLIIPRNLKLRTFSTLRGRQRVRGGIHGGVPPHGQVQTAPERAQQCEVHPLPRFRSGPKAIRPTLFFLSRCIVYVHVDVGVDVCIYSIDINIQICVYINIS